jgi:hypothetical protein
MGEERKLYKVLVGKSKKRYHLKDQGVDGSMGSDVTYVDWLDGVDWIRLAQDMTNGKLL